MIQPDQVKQQLAQHYQELEETGEVIKPLLETDVTPSCTSTSSSSDDCFEETYTKAQKQKQVKFDRYAIIYGEDAPMPPSLKKPQTPCKGSVSEAKSSSNSTASSSGLNTNTSSKKTKQTCNEDCKGYSSSSASSIHSSKNSKNSGIGVSTSLGSSSAILVTD